MDPFGAYIKGDLEKFTENINMFTTTDKKTKEFRTTSFFILKNRNTVSYMFCDRAVLFRKLLKKSIRETINEAKKIGIETLQVEVIISAGLSKAVVNIQPEELDSMQSIINNITSQLSCYDSDVLDILWQATIDPIKIVTTVTHWLLTM